MDKEPLKLVVSGEKPQEIIARMVQYATEVPWVLTTVRGYMPPLKLKREIYEYQAACLYVLAKQYNQAGMRILEIGTALGYSAAIMAMAAPQAEIITLNPRVDEATQAIAHLARWPNVTVKQVLSWEYLRNYPKVGFTPQKFNLIFVDGDHARVRLDLPWWEYLLKDGLFLFHDYSPEGSGRPCPPVYQALHDFALEIHHPLDVCIVDDQQVGLAGFYKGSEP